MPNGYYKLRKGMIMYNFKRAYDLEVTQIHYKTKSRKYQQFVYTQLYHGILCYGLTNDDENADEFIQRHSPKDLHLFFLDLKTIIDDLEQNNIKLVKDKRYDYLDIDPKIR